MSVPVRTLLSFVLAVALGCGGKAKTTTTTPAAPASYTVTFAAGTGGTLSGATTQTVTSGGSATAVTAVPNTGYVFSYWTSAQTQTFTTADVTVTGVFENTTLTAEFAPATVPAGHYLVTFVPATGGTLSGSAAQVVAAGGSTTAVTAVASSGYVFSDWTSPQTQTFTTAALALTGVTENITVTANFGGGGIGSLAADIPGVDSTGAACHLSDYTGSVIVLDVSTAWCEWCQVDAPILQALYLKYQGQGLKVVTVLTEEVNGTGPCPTSVLQNWASTYGLTFRVQSDAGGAGTGNGEKVYESKTGGFPTFVIIDKNFKVQYLQGGYDASSVTAKVAALLAE